MGFLLFTLTAHASTPWFKSESWILPNGLQVVLLPNHRAPFVHVSVWYKAGGADDLPGKSGTAHYLEHLMFRGTKDVKSGEHSQSIKAWGGDDNAFTSLDVTAYFETVPADKLGETLRLEASRMRGIAPKPEEAATEHQVIQQERRQTIESDPQRVFGEESNVKFYPDHPYGRPIIGTPDEIKALTMADAMQFHDRWYGPDNAILVLAGDIDRRTAEPLVTRYFGMLKPVNAPERLHLERGPLVPKDDALIQKCEARIDQPILGITWRLPSARWDTQTALTAQVAETLLSGDPTSPLYQILVVREKVATAFGVSYSGHLGAAGTFDVSLWPAPGMSSDKIFTALDKALREAFAKHLTEVDVRRAIKQLRLGIELAPDQPIGLAMMVGQSLAMGDTLADIQEGPNWLDAVTLKDLRRFAERYLFNRERGALRSVLLPASEVACAR